MKRMFRVGVAVVASAMVLTLCVDAVNAQGGRGGRGGQGGQGGGRGGFGGQRGGGMFGGGGSYIDLLSSDVVKKEVDISEDQDKEIEAINEDFRSEMGEVFQGFRGQGERPDMEEMRKKMAEMNSKREKDVEKVLIEFQVQRAKEIWVQSLGANALLNEQIQKDLKISASQKTKLDDAQAKLQEERMGMFGRGRGRGGDAQQDEERPSREEMQAKMEELSKETEKTMMGVLNAEQKKAFDDMKGKPFDKLDEIRGGRGGRGGFGGGQGGRGGRGGQGGQGGRGGRGGRGGQGGGDGGDGGGF